MEMELNRRQFLNLATGSVATCLLGGVVPTVGNSDPPIKAIAFDGFTTFDPRSVFALAEQLFPLKFRLVGSGPPGEKSYCKRVDLPSRGCPGRRPFASLWLRFIWPEPGCAGCA